MYHDSAAVLLKDGKIVCAIEEERLNLVKHSNHRPSKAIEFCIDHEGISLDEVDYFSYYCSENNLSRSIVQHSLKNPGIKPYWSIRSIISNIFLEDLNYNVSLNKLKFVEHHLCHAVSSYAQSGFENSLVVTLDGQGDGASGHIYNARNGSLEKIRSNTVDNSLGLFYDHIIGFLGYGPHDEYKVMGLAPYGDPNKYRTLFDRFYSLLPEDQYSIDYGSFQSLFEVASPRRKYEVFDQVYKHLAASLQYALETIVLHILKHFQSQTGQRRLCLAGGVAHNCAMKGKFSRPTYLMRYLSSRRPMMQDVQLGRQSQHTNN